MASDFHVAVTSSDPEKQLDDFAASLETHVSNARLARVFDELLAFYTHPCSIFSESEKFHEVAAKLLILASRYGNIVFGAELECTLSLEQWEDLPVDAKKHLALEWNPYRREGIGFVLIACGKLVLTSVIPVVEAYPGIHHGGIWVINARVPEQHITMCPASFSDDIDGFQIVWIPAKDE